MQKKSQKYVFCRNFALFLLLSSSRLYCLLVVDDYQIQLSDFSAHTQSIKRIILHTSTLVYPTFIARASSLHLAYSARTCKLDVS